MYKRRIQQMMDRHEQRLTVDMGDLRRYSTQLADGYVVYAFVYCLRAAVWLQHACWRRCSQFDQAAE